MSLSVASQRLHSNFDSQASASPPVTFRATSLIIIFFLWAAIYVAGMFTPALLDDADTVHAEAAREMVQRHDWVTLYVNGIRYLEKAPLMYWGVATSYVLFGVHDWSTRLPLMLGILAWLLAAYALGRYAYGERGGFYSAIVLATALGPYLFTRFLIPDTLVGLWLILGFYFFFYFLHVVALLFLNRRGPRVHALVPLFLFWVLLLFWLFPWISFLPRALRQFPIRGRRMRAQLDREGHDSEKHTSDLQSPY